MTTAPTTIPRMGRRRKTVDQSTYSGRVAVRLRELRERAGKTVPEMALAVGVAELTWYRYESNERGIPFDMLPDVAAILGVSIRQIIPAK